MAKFVCFGEILVRLSGPAGERLSFSQPLTPHLGGAEANVAVLLARRGHDVEMVSALPDTVLSSDAKGILRGHGVNTDFLISAQGRQGLYFLEPSAMMRPAQVIYDRTQSSFCQYDFATLDWDRILSGADWLHISGITLALGTGTAQAAIAAARLARKNGTKVSFDCNYRANLWAGQEEKIAERMREMMKLTDCLFAGPRDANYLLRQSFVGPDPTDSFAKAGQAYRAQWPQIDIIASTHREIVHASHHRLTGILNQADHIVTSRTHELINIVDRIGSGDAFAGGLLDQLARSIEPQDAVEFATASAAIKHSVKGDFNTVFRSDINLVVEAGYADVSR